MAPPSPLRKFAHVLVWIALPHLAQCDDSAWGGCVDPANPGKLVRRDSATTVCLTLGPDGNWADGVEYVRFSFKPEADKYSRFTIPNSYQNLVQSTSIYPSLSATNITVHAASQTSLSFLRTYYQRDLDYVFPHLTAIVDVKDGIVQGIAWDKACMFCNDERCLENTLDFSGQPRQLDEPTDGCYLTKSECDTIHENGGTECDLTLYVVWTGSDVNGNTLSSSKFRFSAFRGKQIMDTFRDGLSNIEFPSLPW